VQQILSWVWYGGYGNDKVGVQHPKEATKEPEKDDNKLVLMTHENGRRQI
jgi:hypothetical protein